LQPGADVAILALMIRPICILLALAAHVRAADMFPFTLPWDDASETVISLAHLNDKPAGRNGFVHVKDGHLFAGEKRLRIFGVNVCFGGNFPTHEAAEKVAARMAKFGINCVRFHHLDMFSAPNGIFARDGKTLDPDRLDRLDYFIAKLKEHGIYADLNLHVSRTYPDLPKSEKKGSPDYDKGVDNYYPAMIAMQKDYARDLLTHVNPYTGKRYAEEPAVALIEINNENALGFQWWAAQMDELPAPYAAELEKQWGAWIAKRYFSDEKAKEAWSKGAREPGDEVLKPANAWFHEQHGAAAAKNENQDGLIRVTVEKPGGEAWHVQFNQSGLRIAKGENYEVRLRIRAPKQVSINLDLQQAHAPWKILGSANVKAGPDARDVGAVIRTSDGDDNARLSISGMGQTTGTFEFENISLRIAGVDGSLTRSASGGVDFPRKRIFARHTAAKQRDWQQFIWDTETKYWNGMRDFLKTELGTKALVLGTQGFWSPGHVQAGMDVIDSHAYWHHPDFQGRGWNQDVWTVKNESMAGAPDGGELSRLAAQRVAGKPFLCTEYNHPAPNTYSAETFPLLLAFAAAQDWDGIFAFAYSHRGDTWDLTHFNTFFDIDRHSVKMATLPSAVAAFRRGDIAPFKREARLQLNASDALESGIRSGPGFVRQRGEFKGVDLFATRFAAVAGQGDTTLTNSTVNEETRPQFLWNTESRLTVVDTPRTKLVVGRVKPDSAIRLGEVTLTPGETRQGWACYQLSAIDDADISSAKRLLITATGDTANTDLVWRNAEKTSVGRAWGKAPVLVECPAAKIEIAGKGPLRAWALNERGERKTEIPVQGTTIAIGPQYQTLWFEVTRE
jgi:hypothetical protein